MAKAVLDSLTFADLTEENPLIFAFSLPPFAASFRPVSWKRGRNLPLPDFLDPLLLG
jgi:hypothetical protein